jgi:CPA2 family monovalent cation:H+ antiporter-2
VIIVGYGLNGRNVTSVLRETGIPYIVAEINVDLFREAVAAGHRAMYGDGTREAILSGLGIARARALVVAISDPLATRMIIRAARLLNGNVFLIARTRYVSEIGELSAMGADEVIPEEFETSIEIFTRVLRKYHLPRNVIAAQVELLRREGYGMMRGMQLPEAAMEQIETILAAGTTDTFLVLPDSPSVGKRLLDLEIRRRTGASVLSIVRDGKPIVNPPPETPLAAGDILVLIGTHRDVDRAFDLLEGKAGTGS